jgi:large subunit ribosomal protein L6
MSTNIEKKYAVKIPNNILVLYCPKKRILKFITPFKKKSLKLDTKILISASKNLLIVTQTPFSEISKNKKKSIKAMQGTCAALIKQIIIELSTTIHQKLKFVGIGYKVFNIESHADKLIMFKLGFSHAIYFKIPDELKIFCLKSTKLFIYGNLYQNITQTSAQIKSYKYPDPYKGKGILYWDEKIKLKEGKKI